MKNERITCINCGECIADANGTSSPEVARLYKRDAVIRDRLERAELLMRASYNLLLGSASIYDAKRDTGPTNWLKTRDELVAALWLELKAVPKQEPLMKGN